MQHDRWRILLYCLRSARSQARSLARVPAGDRVQQLVPAKSHLLSLYMSYTYPRHKGGDGPCLKDGG
jgi:hypothetical protein